MVLGPVAAAGAMVPETVAAAAADHLDKDSNRQTIIEVFDGINAFRASKGLKPLKFNTGISKVSQQWSNQMATRNLFAHNPDYTVGVTTGWGSASENIAARWDRSGQGLVDQWIGSPPHNANMSTPGWQYLGIGVSYSDETDFRYPTYSTTNFFRYGDKDVPPGTYHHPRDFFNGKPQLKPTTSTAAETPVAPVFDTVKRTYTIPKVEGIDYRVTVGGFTWIMAPGTYPARAGLHTVQAVAATGYGPIGRYVWKRTFPKVKVVTAARPVLSSKTNRYTIPKRTGVTYFVDGKAVKAGTYSVTDGKQLKFTAKAASSIYRITSTKSWTYRF